MKRAGKEGKAHRAFIAAAVLVLLLSAGCGSDSPSGPAGDGVDPVIRNSTVVIPENGDLFLWSREGPMYIFGFSGEPPFVSCWKAAAGTGEGGYIRRIFSASVEGKRIFAETGDASLTDLLVSGLVSASFDAGPGTARGGIDLSGLVLCGEESGDGPYVKIAKGSAGYSPRVELSIKIIDGRAELLSMKSEGDFTADLSLEARLPGGFECSREIPVASFTSGWVVHAGRLPVPLSARLDIAAGIEMAGDSIRELEIDCSADNRLESWCENKSGSWSAGGKADTALSIGHFTCAARSQGSVMIRLLPSISVSVYGEPLFRAEFEHRIIFESLAGEDPYWHWVIRAGSGASTRFSPRVIDAGLPPLDTENFFTERPAFRGPYSNGKYILTLAWGTEGSGDHGFILPWGIASTPQGGIVVTDNQANKVRVFAPDSTLLLSWGAAGNGPGEFLFPCGAAADGEGNIYVVDRGNHRIQKFSPSGGYAGEWGSFGVDDGFFTEPERVAVAPSGEVLVTDGYTNKVQAFSPEGTFLYSWGGFGYGPGQFSGAAGIAVSESGEVFVSDCHGNRVQRFSPGGTYLSEWGGGGPEPGFFNCAVDLCAVPGGMVAVADYGNRRVQVFTEGGALVSIIGSDGASLGEFSDPRGVTASPGGTLFVSDSGNHRIQVFEPLE